jgi:hypothetical protein
MFDGDLKVKLRTFKEKLEKKKSWKLENQIVSFQNLGKYCLVGELFKLA